jgi:hypothetical protein
VFLLQTIDMLCEESVAEEGGDERQELVSLAREIATVWLPPFTYDGLLDACTLVYEARNTCPDIACATLTRIASAVWTYREKAKKKLTSSIPSPTNLPPLAVR